MGVPPPSIIYLPEVQKGQTGGAGAYYVVQTLQPSFLKGGLTVPGKGEAARDHK